VPVCKPRPPSPALPPPPLSAGLTLVRAPMGQAKVVFDSCMRGSERVIAEASLLGALPLTDACQTGANFADVPIQMVVPMAHKRGDEVAYATSLHEQVAKMMDGYWDLLPLYAPYRQVGLAAAWRAVYRSSFWPCNCPSQASSLGPALHQAAV
jgi:hypothetical protein